jgi:ubiquinone/menaquinone biosynthesis C-methylase UbiE
MGINYEDYLKEAFRVLKTYGLVFIAEPKSKWDNRTGYLIQIMENIGFTLQSKENSDKFYYFVFVKP